ncbi:MAG TPA: Pr6Pr family membrane protein [Edaphobacter sp.]|nr:Pr6Pr family membrane protein [Edaphobacter sp.]
MRSAETPLARTAAALLALIAWAGMVTQFHATLNLQRSALSTIWALYPLAYLAYPLIRGEFTRRYHYPFIDVNEVGWTRAMTNAFLIAIAFLGPGWLIVWFDSLLGRSLDPTLSAK